MECLPCRSVSAYNVARGAIYTGNWLAGIIFLALAISAHAQVISGIIGGQTAAPGAWPWQVSLGVGTPAHSSPFCGGTLVAPGWVLTAAHCVVDSSTGAVMDPANLIITAGVTDLTDPNAFHSGVTAIIPNEQFNRQTELNDIALLQLARPADCASCGVIGLVQPDQEAQIAPPGTIATVTGWGDTNPDPSVATYPTQLMQADVPIVSNAECASLYSPEQIADSMVCAGWVGTGGKDSCQGDSGGPLVVRKNDGTGFSLEGIVSWGKDCAQPGFPGVYTRASSYASWVNSLISSPAKRSRGGGGATDALLLVIGIAAALRRWRTA